MHSCVYNYLEVLGRRSRTELPNTGIRMPTRLSYKQVSDANGAQAICRVPDMYYHTARSEKFRRGIQCRGSRICSLLASLQDTPSYQASMRSSYAAWRRRLSARSPGVAVAKSCRPGSGNIGSTRRIELHVRAEGLQWSTLIRIARSFSTRIYMGHPCCNSATF